MAKRSKKNEATVFEVSTAATEGAVPVEACEGTAAEIEATAVASAPKGELEEALDRHAPGWRAREKAKKTTERKPRKDPKKSLPKAARPEHSNTETPEPAAEDRAAPEVDRTMARLQVRWCAALERAGKTKATVAGYRAALGTACDHFGDSTPVASLTARKIENYNASDGVTKKRNGKAAARTGVDKTRRALRLALDWAARAGWIPATTESA